MAKFAITLDTRKGTHGGEPVRVRVGDKESCEVAATITEGGTKKDLANITARFECLKPDGTRVLDTECTVTAAESLVEYTLAPQVSAAPGEISLAYFALFDEDGERVDSTQSFVIVVERGVGDIESTDYINEVDAIIRLLEAQRQAYDAAEQLRAQAEAARAAAEKERASAEAARAKAETDRDAAEDERTEAEGLRATAEEGRTAAESARAKAETGRAKAEGLRGTAEDERIEAEKVRAAAESGRTEAETARDTAEDARIEAERARAAAEGLRDTAEQGRASAEGQRDTAEGQRVAAEGLRATAENARTEAESGRASAEGLRETAEEGRAAAETLRAQAEQERADAQDDRDERQDANDADQARNNAQQAANNSAALGLTFVILSEGQYDADTLEPTVEGETGKMYLVPDPKGGEDDVYSEWIWIPGTDSFEHMGSTSTNFDPMTTADVDAVTSDQSPSGDRTMNVTALSYLWTKLKAAFAAISHTHTVSQVTDFPSSMPASDVSAWAKATEKPSYAPQEVGAAPSDHGHEVTDVDGLPGALEGLQPRPTYATVTVQPGDWQGLSCVKQVQGVTAESIVTCGAAPASELVASAAHVYCSAQAAESLTFSCVTVPEEAVTLNVEIREA